MNRIILLGGLAALTLTACGGSPNKGSSAQDEEQALKFARCMRAHGIDMPDPQVGRSGAIEMHVRSAGKGPVAGGPARGGPAPARMQAAVEGCRKYAPNGGKPPSPAEQQEMRDQALAFSRCMRSHGIDIPDPQVEGGGVRIGGPKVSINPDSPSFRSAQQACGSLMPGPKGGSGPSLSVHSSGK